MGRGRGSVGRNHSRRASRKSPGTHAGGLGSGMGRGRTAVRVVLFVAAESDSLACFIPDWDCTGAAGFLRAAVRAGSTGLFGVTGEDRIGRPAAVILRDFQTTAFIGYVFRGTDGDRGAGRILRGHDVAAHVSSHGEKIVRARL